MVQSTKDQHKILIRYFWRFSKNPLTLEKNVKIFKNLFWKLSERWFYSAKVFQCQSFEKWNIMAERQASTLMWRRLGLVTGAEVKLTFDKICRWKLAKLREAPFMTLSFTWQTFSEKITEKREYNTLTVWQVDCQLRYYSKFRLAKARTRAPGNVSSE